MKKFLSFFVFSLLYIALFAVSASASDETIAIRSRDSREFLNKLERYSSINSDALAENFSDGYLNKEAYPVVQLIGCEEECRTIIEEQFGPIEFEIETVKYKGEYLREVFCSLTLKHIEANQLYKEGNLDEEMTELLFITSKFGINTFKNNISVFFTAKSPEEFEKAKDIFRSRVLDSDIIDFISDTDFEGVVLDSCAVKVGSGICSEREGMLNVASTGYRAYYLMNAGTADEEKIEGFVTAGHAFNTGEAIYVYNNGRCGYIGEVLFSNFNNGSSGDTAFFRINPFTSSCYISSIDYNDSSVSVTGTYPFPGSGDQVRFSGLASGNQSGQILYSYINVNLAPNHWTIYGAIMTDVPVQATDSGGCLYTKPVNGQANPIGILHGHDTAGSYYTSNLANVSCFDIYSYGGRYDV